ncbi:methyltransferase [Vibrio sp. CAIM 722]|uniref:Ribosomal RNA large subunit methyltransferase G n=1 Tax=Vibrio eleionomae TaxID=2653505 RepID=A0A7X4LGZ6_9VIBR|nr:methyltransferase [Vibrio eleionomae]MZI91706.1 methyltransferase [Vibrio eleionomae]
MNTELTLHQKTLTLHRYPVRTNEMLQAWDAGDEYLINHIEEQEITPQKHILILNDHFGALSCWFSQHHRVTVISDSFISHQGIKHNLEQNHCPTVTLLTSVDDIPNDVDMVLMQIPRNNRFLGWQLSQLRTALCSNVPLIAVNKAKDIHNSTLKLFEQWFGATTTSLAWKKHRLVFSQPNTKKTAEHPPYLEWNIEHESIMLKNLPNVYSGENLDQGARFMLEHLPADPNIQHFTDLGCGNGVLSVKMGQLNPQANIRCVDESFMAVESARQNLLSNLQHAHQRDIECLANNCLDNIAGQSTDMVLCNPPFHQQQAITDHIAWQMFCDAKHVLKKQGKLLVIGNRHLRYDIKLSRLFGKSNVKTVTGNKKFVILEATK